MEGPGVRGRRVWRSSMAITEAEGRGSCVLLRAGMAWDWCRGGACILSKFRSHLSVTLCSLKVVAASSHTCLPSEVSRAHCMGTGQCGSPAMLVPGRPNDAFNPFLFPDTNSYPEVSPAPRVHVCMCLGPIGLVSTQRQLMCPASQPRRHLSVGCSVASP